MSDIHCWHHFEQQPDGPCPHENPSGLSKDMHPDCVRNCWWGTHFGPSGTCMLADGHEGEHEFTADDEIGVAFT